MRPATKNKAMLVAYERGRAAARQGLPPICPFGSGSKPHGDMNLIYRNYWHRGWEDGKRELVVLEVDAPTASGLTPRWRRVED